MRRSLLILALLLAALACAALWRQTHATRQQTARLERRLALAESENARLRSVLENHQQERTNNLNTSVRREIERAVEEIRGLKFKHPVEYEIVDRKELHSVLAGKLAENFSEEEFANIARAFARLGLLPEGFPLRQSYLDLLGEQIGAFYDQHKHKLVMFAESSLENSQNRVVLAHELTHALQDQNFGLEKLPLEIKDNDDRALAASALVEGEATMVMTQYQLKNLSLAALKDTATATIGQSMAQLEKAPRYLRELLIFPYLRGQEFCGELARNGSYERLSMAYQRLPSSSAEIMHPRLYEMPATGQPIEVAWQETSLNGEAPVVSNVLGELGTRLQLATAVDDETASSAAEGWRGDRYLYFGKSDLLVWKTLWSNPVEAAEFASAERTVLEKRYGMTDPRLEGERFAWDGLRAVRVTQRAGSVIVVDAAQPETAEAALGQFSEK
jgi:hypothetical protein